MDSVTYTFELVGGVPDKEDFGDYVDELKIHIERGVDRFLDNTGIEVEMHWRDLDED